MAVTNRATEARKSSPKAAGKTPAKSAGKGSTRTPGAKTAGKSGSKPGESRQRSVEEINEYRDYQAFKTGITVFGILILSVLFYLSYFGLAGKAGIVVGGLSFGIFGWFAWLFPLACLLGFIFYTVNRGDKRVPRRLLGFGGIVLSILGLTDLIFRKEIITEYYTSNHVLHKGYFECMFLTCSNVMKKGKFNGGLLGRAIASVFSGIIGRVGAIVLLFVLLLLCLYIFYGVEIMGSLRRRNAYHQEMQEIYEEVRQDEEYREPSYRVFSGSRKELEPAAGRKGFKPREMKKVPKVQSFDLLGSEGQEKPDKAASSGKEELPDAKAARQEAIATGEEAAVEQVEESSVPIPPVEAIPIYRNELDEKFGKKRKTEAKVVSFTEASEKRIVEERQKPEPIPEPVVFEEMQDVAEEPVPEPMEEAIDFGADGYEDAEPVAFEQKPMASFAPKEEVTDVTPSSQRGMEPEQPRQSVPSAPAAPVKRESANRQAASAHGKIGGEDYVSASDTFNALNESKVAVDEDIPYEFPPLDLLALPEGAAGTVSDEELRNTAVRLQETLKSFNVNVQMGAVICGPTVTRYELFPEQGVRVNKITNLADDLKLSLAAASIRIEAPIPGKAAVGIEVPNPAPTSVYFRELLEGDAFTNAKSPLTFAVGKDIAGKLIMADIAKMPHLLIAGATGSGKSVCINTLIMSILYKADPKDVKLIMIDPKVVELSVYNGIPHLFCPVVTDPKEAAAALNWAVREMMDRYNKFKELGVRNIAGYNEKIKTVENAEAAGYGKMPYLVVIVDEFADLMMVASKEVEDAVCRLAQLARAAGIHLVLATQRPSVNVITGVIKANIPSRIAFSVSSVIDSRTILDKGGAEKLLGKGDMLFFPSGYSEPVRVQGAFIADSEVSGVVDFLCSNNAVPEYDHSVTQVVEEPKEEETAEKKPQDDRDEYFAEAGRFVIESERAAAGQLQRRFSIGFNRAGRIIDQLNKAGVVGPAEGTKPRKVLMTIEEFERMLSGGDIEPMDDYAMDDDSYGEIDAMVREMEDELVSTGERMGGMY